MYTCKIKVKYIICNEDQSLKSDRGWGSLYVRLYDVLTAAPFFFLRFHSFAVVTCRIIFSPINFRIPSLFTSFQHLCRPSISILSLSFSYSAQSVHSSVSSLPFQFQWHLNIPLIPRLFTQPHCSPYHWWALGRNVLLSRATIVTPRPITSRYEDTCCISLT